MPLRKWTSLNGYFSLLCKMLEKHLWNSSLYLVWLLKCCKNNFYVISKYIFLQSKEIYIQQKMFIWYQNIFSSNQNKFLFNKIYLYDIKIYFHSIEINFFSKIYIYIFLLYEFFIRYFSSDYICSSIFICKSQNFTFSVYKHDVVRKLLRRIQNIIILCNES